MDTPVLPTTKLETASESISPATVLGLGALTAVALTGCLSKKEEDEVAPPAPPANVISRITIKDAAGGAVTISGLNGTPGVTFNLDGGVASNSRATDPGPGTTARSYDFTVSGTGGSGSLGITLNPSPNDVNLTNNASLVSARAAAASMAFPPSWDELMQYASLSHVQLVDRMLARMTGTPYQAYPAWINDKILSSSEYNALSADAKKAYNDRRYPRRQEFKAWWFKQMVTSPDPLSERILLFWHNLFTSSASDLDDPELIARQHRTYRQNSVGNLGTFLKAMSRDPGMCEYLDSARNVTGGPNENFARELLELFTFGELTSSGAYAESDIPVVARAFTGYGLYNNSRFFFDSGNHDFDSKTLWGTTWAGGSGDGDKVIELILAKVDVGGHSYAAKYLVTKLWKEFIGEIKTGDDVTILALADAFAAGGFELKPLYRALFTTAAFTDSTRRGTRIRSPLELYVGIYRPLGIVPGKWDDHLWNCFTLDQDLLDPPNVFGWQGGKFWITPKTLVDRREFMSWVGWSGRDGVADRLGPVLKLLLLATEPVTPPRSATKDRFSDLLIDPAFNLR